MAREGVLRQGVLPLPLREIELSAHALRAMTKIIECLTVLVCELTPLFSKNGGLLLFD